MGSVITVSSGKGLPKKNMIEGDVPVYGGNGITGYHDSPNVYERTIAIGRVGYYCGSVHLTPARAWITDNAFVTTFNEKYLSKAYLLKLLEATNLRGDDSSTAQPVISGRKIYPIEISVPPLAEQKVIAQKLDTLLAQVGTTKARLDRIPDILKRFRQSVLAAAVSGKLTEEWRNSEHIVVLKEKLLKSIEAERQKAWVLECERIGKNRKYKKAVNGDASSLPDIPKTWAWASVDSLSTKVVDGVHKKPVYQPDGVPFVTVKNLTAGKGISFEKLNYISADDHELFYQRTNPERGDILISKDGTLGVVRQVKTDTIFSIFVSVALVKPVLKEMADYLELAFQSLTVQQQMVGVGSGLQHIHLTDLRQDLIPVPPQEEQIQIVNKVRILFEYADTIEKQVEAAQVRVNSLTQSILAKAFRGDLTADWRAANPELISGENSAKSLLLKIKAEREAVKPKRKTKKKA